MSNASIPHKAERSKKLNELLGGLQDLYKDDVKNVIYLCYDLGATVQQVADALGTTKQNVSLLYPKGKKS